MNTTISSFRFQLGEPITLLQIIVPLAIDSTAQLFSLAMTKLQKQCIDSIGGSILYPKSQLSQENFADKPQSSAISNFVS